VTLFLHGVGGTWAVWTPLLEVAATLGLDLGDVLLVDLPGFGASENRHGHLGAEAIGPLLRGLARDLGWSEIRLVGHSMGGFLALDMASRRPPDISSVYVVSGAYFSIVDTVQRPLRSLVTSPSSALAYGQLVALAKAGAAGTVLLEALDRSRLLPLFLRGLFAHPYELPRGVVSYLARSAAPASFLLAAQNADGYHAAARWRQIQVPLRATFGAGDRLVPPTDMMRLERAVPHAITACLPDVAHFGLIERPDLVASFLFGDERRS
jgi:pimeloyl-ACP methyl ester carboxylesterase